MISNVTDILSELPSPKYIHFQKIENQVNAFLNINQTPKILQARKDNGGHRLLNLASIMP